VAVHGRDHRDPLAPSARPNGVVNYVLTSSHLIGSQIAWLAEPQYALLAVTFINIGRATPST